MFERFTEEARQVVVRAQEESRRLRHNYIGTEHILLGLARGDGTLAGAALDSLGITLDRAREQAVRIVGLGDEAPPGQIPFTPRAKKVLELSLREAQGLGHSHIAPEHILLGLIREREGVAARVLLDLGADLDTIRGRTIELMGNPPARPLPPVPALAHVARPEPPENPGWLRGLIPLLDFLAREIRRDLGREPDLADVLVVLACYRESVPGRALEELGVDLDRLWGTIERIRLGLGGEDDAAEQLREVRAAKHEALERQDFDEAATLRDKERELIRRLRPVNTPIPKEVIAEIRRRLGLPD